jgi:uncharacterized protein (DUF1800 family)
MSINPLSVDRLKTLLLFFLTFFVFSHSWALSVGESKHLLFRAGFGAKPVILKQLSALNKKQAIDYLLAVQGSHEPLPNCMNVVLPTRKERKAYSADQRRLAGKERRICANEFKEWYLQDLINDEAVLSNQMTLFWHNHFTSSVRKVKAPQLIYLQHQRINAMALGDFSKLLMAMVKDPAMLIYLDNVNNSKQKPNENLGRELLELFTLGEGHYTEADVLSAAKALTGLGIDPNNYTSVLRENRHDNSEKRIFNDQKIRSADDLVHAILAHPQTSRHITNAIWLHFISKEDNEQINRIAKTFTKDWSIAKLVTAVLSSEQFWQDAGQMFKSPVELTVGSAQLFKGLKVSPKRLLKMQRDMGQNLFDPPNVKGWPKGENWIDANKLLVRSQLTSQLARAISANMAQMGAPYCSGSMATLTALDVPKMDSTENSMGGNCQKQLVKLVTDPSWQLK